MRLLALPVDPSSHMSAMRGHHENLASRVQGAPGGRRLRTDARTHASCLSLAKAEASHVMACSTRCHDTHIVVLFKRPVLL